MDKQGGIYARYSPGRDRDQTSTIEAQVAMCREKAERDGDSRLTPIISTLTGASLVRV